MINYGFTICLNAIIYYVLIASEFSNLGRLSSISALLSICNDYSFSRELWKHHGEHVF